MAQDGKQSVCRRPDPLDKQMATHSGILAWKIPWTEEPDRLQSMGSQSQTRLSDFTIKKAVIAVKSLPANVGDIRDTGSIPAWGGSPAGGHSNPLQYSCLENPMDRQSLEGYSLQVTKSQTRLKQLSTHASKQRITAIFTLSFFFQESCKK